MLAVHVEEIGLNQCAELMVLLTSLRASLVALVYSETAWVIFTFYYCHKAPTKYLLFGPR